MVAFQNNTEDVESETGPLRSHDAIEAAILSGKLTGVAPDDYWLVAWFRGDTDEVEALEFMPIKYCKDRWPVVADIEGIDRKTVTIEVHGHGPYILLHPQSEPQS